MDIDDFDLVTWQESYLPKITPDWLKEGAETTFYNTFVELVEERKLQVKSSDNPIELAIKDYQVQHTDVTDKLGKSRSAIRKDRYPQLLIHFDETNALLFHYWKVVVDKYRKAKGTKNKPQLADENRELKEEVKQLKAKLQRNFIDQIMENVDQINTKNKVAHIAELEERNRELERQVARLSHQLRANFKSI